MIGPATLERLHAASPYNVVRLILPGLSFDARTAGQVAAARLRDWLDSGVLTVDDEPALYVYEQRGTEFTQRGLIGLVGVGTGGILPHEGVMPGPVAGRRELMAATRCNLEPILLVYNSGVSAGGHRGPAGTDHRGTTAAASGGAASRRVDLTADQRPPLARAVTSDGVTHRLWALTDPGEQAEIIADLAGRTALIADGHHRFAAYRELRDSLRTAGNGAGPWDFGLAFLVDADSYPLRLGPIHRVIPDLAPAEAARLAAEAFTVSRVPETDLPGALRSLADAGRQGPAFLLAGQAGFTLLTDPDQVQLAAAMPLEASPHWQALDASVMQELLLARLWSIKDNERDVLISHDAAEAAQLAAETGGTAVLCNPMPLAAVMEVAAQGERVPRKSTSFGPKPRTGLVLRTFDA